jgi:hypothetical protein
MRNISDGGSGMNSDGGSGMNSDGGSGMNLRASTNLLGYFIMFIALIIILVGDYVIFETDSNVGGLLIILGIVVALFGTLVLLG